MAPFITWATLCVSTVTAVKFFGDTPSTSQYGAIQDFSQALEQDGAKLVGVLRSSKTDSQEISDFLTLMGYKNGTLNGLKENYTPAIETGLSIRQTIDTSCNSGSKVVFGNTANFQICTVLAGLAGGATATLAFVIQQGTCTTTDTGMSTFCNAAFVFFGTTGTTVSAVEVSQYCPGLLSKITTSCSNKGGDATETDYEFIEQIQQTDLACADETGSCTQTSIS